MPLSEDEQRILAQIERGLTRDDPRFPGTVDLSRWRRRRIALAVPDPLVQVEHPLGLGLEVGVGDEGPRCATRRSVVSPV